MWMELEKLHEESGRVFCERELLATEVGDDV
jgi:hypothetical protein